MTNLKVVDRIDIVIGSIASATIDIGDIETIVNGMYINQISVLMHEVTEQYGLQVRGLSYEKSHRNASGNESNIIGVFVSPWEREPNSFGNMKIPVYNLIFREEQVGNVIIRFDKKNNVKKVIRKSFK